MVATRSMMGSERQVIEEEDHRIDPVAAMLETMRDLEGLKRKNVEEMDVKGWECRDEAKVGNRKNAYG